MAKVINHDKYKAKIIIVSSRSRCQLMAMRNEDDPFQMSASMAMKNRSVTLVGGH